MILVLNNFKTLKFCKLLCIYFVFLFGYCVCVQYTTYKIFFDSYFLDERFTSAIDKGFLEPVYCLFKKIKKIVYCPYTVYNTHTHHTIFFCPID